MTALSAHAHSVQTTFLTSVTHSQRATVPFRHWLLGGLFPASDAEAVYNLDVPVPTDLAFVGKREANNAKRVYFNPPNQAKFPVVKAVAEAFQDSATIAVFKAECGVDLTGTSLRIEYCQDTEGFWLEPHTDIGAKKFTMLVYISQEPGWENWGTDVYGVGKQWHSRMKGDFNSAMMFVPGADTFHGFEARTLGGLRKSLIVNYVGPEWKAREELSFPETPVA